MPRTILNLLLMDRFNLNMLNRVIKSYFREKIVHALEQPVPEMIWEIMAWILQRKEELKQRAYLAQYLVKIPVPAEILMDQEVSDCYGTVSILQVHLYFPTLFQFQNVTSHWNRSMKRK
jgi:hypothetical protein